MTYLKKGLNEAFSPGNEYSVSEVMKAELLAAKMEPNTILIVADNPNVLELVRVNCVAQGLHVLAAANGIKAMQIIEKSVPKLIILDTMKPEMNGWKVCELIRERYQESIKIIMLVTEDWEPKEAIVKFVPIPDEYIVKPFDTNGLISSVKRLLSDNLV